MDRPGMRRFLDVENGDIVLKPEEEVIYSLNNIEVAFSSVDLAVGRFNLKITNQRITLLNSDTCYEFDVPFIALHAISRDPESYPKPCIYCQLDQEEDETPDELFLIPDDESVLHPIFDALSKAAMLNPDADECGEFEGDDELIYNVDEVELGAAQAARLAHFESIFVEPTMSNSAEAGIFDDVEDESVPPKKKK